ncbi:g9199 [Coccomyxa elongata]
MHAVPIFDGNNGTFFLDNTQFAYKCEEGGGWHDFFAYQDHLVPWSAAKERAGGEECVRHNFRGVDDVLHVNLKAGWEPYNAAGVSQAWVFQPWVQSVIDGQLKALAAAEKPTMGFHIRWGDKIEEDILFKRPTTHPKDYIESFTKNFPDIKGGTCVLVGDDVKKVTEAADFAKKLIGCKIMQNKPYYRTAGHVQVEFNNQTLDKRCMSTVQLLLDIETLAHADYMTGTLNSGIPYLIEVLRYTLYNKERSSFVDASFLHNDWWQKVRDLFHPPTEDEEEEECTEGDPDCEDEEEEEEDSARRRRQLLQRGPLGQEPRRLRRRSKTMAEIDTLLTD